MNTFVKSIKRLWEAFCKTKTELWISILILFFLALSLSGIMYLAEHMHRQSYQYWDALAWTFVKFVEDPAEIVDPPITILGQIVGTLIGVVGIAVFAVPAGFFTSWFVEAMDKWRRDEELEKYHNILLNSFKVKHSTNLKKYLSSLPGGVPNWCQKCTFGYLANNINVAKFRIKGIELKDLIEVCKKYPEFRIKNESSAVSIESNKQDRYLLEHFPINRRYGFFMNRGSSVTIVSTASNSELCTGNFSYYLAKYAGFNYISKEFGVADGESYFNNHWGAPFFEGLYLDERKNKGEVISKKIQEIYENKLSLRNEFISDLKSLCKDEGCWVICIHSCCKNKQHEKDIYLSYSKENGLDPTISNISQFNDLYQKLSMSLKTELNLSVDNNTAFPLVKRGTYKSLLYKLLEDRCINGLSIHVSSSLMEFDTNMRVALFIMANTIHDALEPRHILKAEEIKDMNRTSRCRGYLDQDIESVKKYDFKYYNDII